MPAPFYNAIKGTTSGTPGTGAFTPNAASSGYRAWSTVPSGWIGLVRFEDGSSWELTYSYWNGTTLSRASTQLYDSSSGSAISLTSSATASMVVDARSMSGIVGGENHRFDMAIVNGTSASNIGIGTVTTTGTAAASNIATTNLLTEQPRFKVTSVTTASGQAGRTNTIPQAVVSTTAGRGGWEWVCRFGVSGLPTGPRLFCGMTSTTFVANAGEPSALVANVAIFGKDSTDTNIQLMVNSNVSTCTKTDTGLTLNVNDWYETTIWNDSGSTTIKALLINLASGAIWFGTTSTDTPANGALLMPQLIVGLNGTNTGTAAVLEYGQMGLRVGA